jgi:hypothetical protein
MPRILCLACLHHCSAPSGGRGRTLVCPTCRAKWTPPGRVARGRSRPLVDAECPACGHGCRVRPDQLGRTVICPNCERRFVPPAGRRLPVLAASAATVVVSVAVLGLTAFATY